MPSFPHDSCARPLTVADWLEQFCVARSTPLSLFSIYRARADFFFFPGHVQNGQLANHKEIFAEFNKQCIGSQSLTILLTVVIGCVVILPKSGYNIWIHSLWMQWMYNLCKDGCLQSLPNVPPIYLSPLKSSNRCSCLLCDGRRVMVSI